MFGKNFLYHKNENVLKATRLRVYDPERRPEIGNAVILIAAERYANALLAIDCKRRYFLGLLCLPLLRYSVYGAEMRKCYIEKLQNR